MKNTEWKHVRHIKGSTRVSLAFLAAPFVFSTSVPMTEEDTIPTQYYQK